MCYYYLTCIIPTWGYKKGQTKVVEAPRGLLKSEVIRRHTRLNPAKWA
jgi:hypothetical protein